MNKNVARRTKFHDFKDANGKSISYAVLRAILDESEEWIRTRLKQEKKVPDQPPRLGEKDSFAGDEEDNGSEGTAGAGGNADQGGETP